MAEPVETPWEDEPQVERRSRRPGQPAHIPVPDASAGTNSPRVWRVNAVMRNPALGFQVVEYTDYGRVEVGPVGETFRDPRDAAAYCRSLRGAQ